MNYNVFVKWHLLYIIRRSLSDIFISTYYGLIMRLTLLMVIIFSLQVSANTLAQQINLDVKNQPLASVLRELRKQSGYAFIYNEKHLTDAKPVTVKLQNRDILDVLPLIFDNQPLEYTIKDKVINISPKKPMGGIATAEEEQPIQQQPIRGRVTDSDGQPLAGATIRIKGTAVSFTTDKDGYFEIPYTYREGTLQISYVGYIPVEVATRQASRIALAEYQSSVGDINIAVSTGYQTLPAERVTGSFAQVDNELFNRQVSTDVISRLKAIAPSILFDERSGSPKLTIRGMSTIFGNADPLIVVDGFVYDGDIQNINPNDVENIDILRDAAAASIWGVRASNGVIVISTKSGKTNQPMQVEVGSNVTFVGKPDLFYQPRMTPSDMVDVEIMLFNNNHYNTELDDIYTYPYLTPVVEILAAQRAGTITEAEATRQINIYRNQNVWNDIDRYLYQTGINQQHNLNLKGGTERHRYYFSAGYDNNKSNQIANGFNRLTLNAQQIFNPLKNLEITTGITYTQSKNVINGSAEGINTFKNYNVRLVDDQGNHLPVGTNYRTSFVNSVENDGLLNWQFVPLDELNLQDNTAKLMENRLKGGIKYTIIPGLSAESSYQYQRQNTNGRYLTNADSYYTRDQINRFTSITPQGVKHNIPLGSIVNFSNRVQQSHTGRFQINYNQSFDKHSIAAIGGFEVRQMTIDSDSHRLYGYDELTGVSGAVNYDVGYTPYPIGFTTFIPRGQGVTGIIDRFRSWYGNVSYTYNDRYTLSGSARVDQSNLFGVDANQRSVPLWSIGGKYSLDKEDFYQWDAVPSLKLRATYGYNGNLDNSITAYTTATVGNSFYHPSQRQAYILTPPNSNLQWERTGIFNLGIDFATKHNRISGSLDYFTKKNNDLIGEVIVDPTTGFETYRGNFANTKGKGLDILLNTINIQNTIFSWSSQFLYSYAIDEVSKYDIDPTANQLYTDQSISRFAPDYTPVVGKPLFGVYSHDWAGLDPDTGSPRGYLEGELSMDYTAINRAIADDPVEMLNYHGRALPPHFGAVRNTFSYRDISLSFNIAYRFGYSFRRSSLSYISLFSYNGHSDYTLRWQQAGDELTTDVPSMIYPANANRDTFYSRSEVLIERGDHIRLQDVNLTYHFRKLAAIQNIVNDAALFFYANNLGLLWKANDKGIDPDFPTNKPIRTFAVGLRTNF